MSAILKFLEKTKYQGDNNAVIGFGLPSLEAFHEQHKPTGFEKYSETFINYLKDKYSNEEWVAINDFDTPVEDIEVEEEVISPLTERGCYKGDWERLAHTTQVEVDGMMKNYERSIDRFENVQEINEFITDTPFNLTAGNANASNVSEIGTFFVKPDTLTIPTENLDVTKLSNLAVSLINTYNDCAERFNALDIADKEQLEFPPLLSILSQMISSVQTLIDKRTNSSNAPITKELLNDDQVVIVQNFSNEGIYESMRKFFGISNRGDQKKMFNAYTNAASLLNDFKHNFGTGNWIDKQTFVKGKISGDGIYAPLVIRGEPIDILKSIKANDQYTAQYAKLDNQIEAWIRTVKPVYDFLVKNANNLTDDVYKEAKSMFEKLPKPKIGTGDFPQSGYTGVASYPGSPDSIVPVYLQKDQPVEALTPEVAKKAIDAIIKSLEKLQVSARGEVMDKMPDQLGYYIWTEKPVNKKGNISYADWNKLIFDILGVSHTKDSIKEIRARQCYIKAMYACAKWIDRSIKGKHTVSN